MLTGQKDGNIQKQVPLIIRLFLFKDLSHLETRSEEVLLKENVLIQVKTFSVNFHSTLLLFS